MDEVSSAAQSPEASPERPHAVPKILKTTICLSLAAFGVVVICDLGGTLFRELRALSGEWSEARNRFPVGFTGISAEHPEAKPPSCVREDQGHTYLWAGSGAKGQAGWFDVTGTDLPLKQFRFAFGRDKIKTIDYPIFEPVDGATVQRIYPERPVIGLDYDSDARAYPITVLAKVEVVNEMYGTRPIAVTYCPLLHVTAVYERSLDGVPVSFGSSGYCYLDAFVLYDRATDSLWYPRPEGLTAITGRLAGRILPIIERPEPVTWGDWRRRHPKTSVLIGGDRSRGIPLPASDEVASREL